MSQNAIILTERSAALSVTKIYRERLEKSAELVAKKELVSLSTAIDTAATKGLDNVIFKLSTSITKLVDNYFTIAIQVIENDIRAAGYDAERELDQKGNIIGYAISWEEQEEETPNPNSDPNTPVDPNNPNSENPTDPEDPNTPADPTDPDPKDPDDPDDPNDPNDSTDPEGT